MSAVLHCAFVIRKLLNDGAVQCRKRGGELFQYDKSHMKAIQGKLKRVTFCSELIREWFDRMPEKQGNLRKKASIDAKGKGEETFLTRKNIDWVLEGKFRYGQRMKRRYFRRCGKKVFCM